MRLLEEGKIPDILPDERSNDDLSRTMTFVDFPDLIDPVSSLSGSKPSDCPIASHA
jgi:hypothetical protein